MHARNKRQHFACYTALTTFIGKNLLVISHVSSAMLHVGEVDNAQPNGTGVGGRTG